jgi:hypothetical protein
MNLVLPYIFSIWSGVLIVWGVCVVYGLMTIMIRIHNEGHLIRSTDRVHCGIVFFATVVNFLCLFVMESQIYNYIDSIMIVNLWYTVLLFYITVNDLKIWPNLCHLEKIRQVHAEHRKASEKGVRIKVQTGVRVAKKAAPRLS